MTNEFMSGNTSPDNDNDEGILDRSAGFAIKFLARPALNVDDVVTQILENALADVEALRVELDRTNRKSIYDVRSRSFVRVLEGVEEAISYDGLLDIIKELKDGIALRRVQLMNERFDGDEVAL